MALKWVNRDEIKYPQVAGWYRVMVSGDSESIDGHTIYSFDDYETWASYIVYDEETGGFTGEHDEEDFTIFAYCGPIIFPPYKVDKL